MPDVLTLQELTGEEITHIIVTAQKLKKTPSAYNRAMAGRNLLMLFQKTSTRTRLSFELGVQEMGGRAVLLDWDTSNFSVSPIEYEARYVSRHVDMILARLLRHEDMVRLASAATVPTINGCCNRYHPTQALADLMTVYEVSGGFADVTLGYVGMHNNVVNALLAGCLRVGLKLTLVVPKIHGDTWDAPLIQAAAASDLVTLSSDPADLADVDFAYTDTWVDLDHFNNPEYAEEQEQLMAAMMPYQLRAELFSGSQPYILHDMPIHPGLEIEESLIDSERSLIYRQAENRLHVQKSLMIHLVLLHVQKSLMIHLVQRAQQAAV